MPSPLVLALALLTAQATAPTGKEWRALLTKLPAHFVEVTPRSGYAIVYACDDSPLKLGLEGSHLLVAYMRETARFEVVGLGPGPEKDSYTLSVRAEAEPKAPPFAVRLRLLNAARGLWSFWGDENRMFTGKKTFVDEALAKGLRTIKPALGECAAERGGD